MNMDYWYDGQLRKYIIQFIRVFSHFQIREMTTAGEVFTRVPCRYADASRMVSHILRMNSENSVINAPQISVGITNIQMAPERRQDPRLVDTQQITEREYTVDDGVYTNTGGNKYTVQRYMPVPYNLTIQVDILTTNTDSKLQLLEQIMVLFNPSLQLQVNDNPIDWSNVFELELSDIQWSNRSFPQGTEEVLDISTMTFTVLIWISPPAKVTKQKIIQRIIADIHSVPSVRDLDLNDSYYDFFEQFKETAKVVITPGDYRVLIENNIATLVGEGTATWADLIGLYGVLSDSSILELNLSNDLEDLDTRAIGAIEAIDGEPRQLTFTIDVDTLPSDTLDPINAYIDPRAGLPVAAVAGQRYLLSEDISDQLEPNDPLLVWNITAFANDIIEYDGTDWNIVFNSIESIDEEWITNSASGEQLKWTGNDWVLSWQGEYREGFWRLLL